MTQKQELNIKAVIAAFFILSFGYYLTPANLNVFMALSNLSCAIAAILAHKKKLSTFIISIIAAPSIGYLIIGVVGLSIYYISKLF